MTVITIAQNAPVLVAIDIAKARHDVLIAVPGKKRRRRLTVLNKLADFTRLVTTLEDYGRPVRAAFEATGNDHRAFAYHLATAGFEVKLVSSVALARTREAFHGLLDYPLEDHAEQFWDRHPLPGNTCLLVSEGTS
jgi:hypothetical protein